MLKVWFVILTISAICVCLGEGLKCYHCLYVSNTELEISLPGGMAFGKACEQGGKKLKDNYSIDCSNIAWTKSQQNASEKLQSQNETYVCGKAVVDFNDSPVSIFLRTCLRKSDIQNETLIGKCESVQLSSYWDIVAPFLPDPGSGSQIPINNTNTKLCICNDQDKCNGASTLFYNFSIALSVFFVFLQRFC